MQTVIITDIGNDIKFTFSHGDVITLNKLTMKVLQTTANAPNKSYVYLTDGDGFNNTGENKVVRLRFDEVTSPSYADNDELLDGILAMIASVSLGGGGAVGGGGSTWSNAQGDFTATVTDATKNITISALSWTVENINVVSGKIQKIASTGKVTDLRLSNVEVSGQVITLNDIDNFVAGDVVYVALEGPLKAYDESGWYMHWVMNPNYSHNTSPELLIDEANLGIDGVHDGTAAQDTVFTDTGEVFSAANVAEGYEIYNVTDGNNATITVGGAGDPTADDITHAALGANWDTDVASIPEVKRFVMPSTDYNLLTLQYLIATGAANIGFLKLYATLDENADDQSDDFWIDQSVEYLTGLDGFDTDQIKVTASSSAKDLLKITDPTAMLKWMVKIVAECSDGVQNNDFDVIVKKAS